jgi:mRNA interferase RelE/StbE
MLQIIYQKKFLKDLAKLPAGKRKEIEKFVFELLPSATSLSSLNKFEQMTGYPSFFKARFGDYRIGASYNGKSLELIRVLHRREIYRFFP